MRFDFTAPTHVAFGFGAIASLGELAAGLGRRVLIVSGQSPERGERVRDALAGRNVVATTLCVTGEPVVDSIEAAIGRARDEAVDCVIGIGGGSALDAAKAVAAMIPQPGVLLDHLEVIGRGLPLRQPPLPCVAIPTTAGTGSEITRNAVLASPAHRVKVSLRSSHLFPRVAIVDPELTIGLPPDLTAQTGLDALTQLIEPYLSARANAMTDAICVDGLRRAASSLRIAFEDGRNRGAREQMALAALLSGIALTNAGLGAVHAFAAVVGGMFAAPHGAVCAALLPHVLESNLHAISAAGGLPTRRFDEVARLLTGVPTACGLDGVEWIRLLVADLGVPGLGAYGVDAADADDIVSKAAQASSMRANPVALSAEELRRILIAAL
jgi:alcohol dehydrogenase class IV